MNIEERIKTLENKVAQLSDTVLEMNRRNVPVVSKVDDTANKVEQISPYTDTITAYYGETFKTFYEVPQGNVAIFFDNFNGDYTFEREEDRLYITFAEPLTEQTNITISIQ